MEDNEFSRGSRAPRITADEPTHSEDGVDLNADSVDALPHAGRAPRSARKQCAVNPEAAW